MMKAAATAKAPYPAPAPQNRRRPIPQKEPIEAEQLYEAFRSCDAKLAGPDGEMRPLPETLYSFLLELIGLLGQGKPATIAQAQAKLTTIEAASILGVSRQFLVNLLEKGEIPYHMVGTHRRIYAQDLHQYRAKRDCGRHTLIRELAQAEARDGLYDRGSSPIDED